MKRGVIGAIGIIAAMAVLLCSLASVQSNPADARMQSSSVDNRKVSIEGMVAKPGEYRLTEPMNVLQLVVLAGGLLPHADTEHIEIHRPQPDGKVEIIKFDYAKLFNTKELIKIPMLKPGDQVIVK